MLQRDDMTTEVLSASDLILSCTICQTTLSNVRPAIEHHEGLGRVGGEHGDGKTVKLWLTECAHLTCASHFEGGGEKETLHE